MTEEEELDIAKLSAFVAKEIRKDGEVVMDPEDINLFSASSDLSGCFDPSNHRQS